MKLFIDTEFNGFGGELISMAIVAEDGREWYGILPVADKLVEWVEEHVRPVLDIEGFSLTVLFQQHEKGWRLLSLCPKVLILLF